MPTDEVSSAKPAAYTNSGTHAYRTTSPATTSSNHNILTPRRWPGQHLTNDHRWISYGQELNGTAQRYHLLALRAYRAVAVPGTRRIPTRAAAAGMCQLRSSCRLQAWEPCSAGRIETSPTLLTVSYDGP